nr:GyrI-like domain-containing protein [Sphingomonas sp. G-3-2-10]
MVDGAALHLAGIRRRHAPGKMPAESRRQWMDLVALGNLPGQVSQIAYGLHLEAPDAATVDYFTAVEVAGFDGLPDTVERMILPAQRYAMFAHDGHVNDARTLRARIAAEHGGKFGTPDFERFHESFDPISATGRIELWFPLAP